MVDLCQHPVRSFLSGHVWFTLFSNPGELRQGLGSKLHILLCVSSHPLSRPCDVAVLRPEKRQSRPPVPASGLATRSTSAEDGEQGRLHPIGWPLGTKSTSTDGWRGGSAGVTAKRRGDSETMRNARSTRERGLSRRFHEGQRLQELHNPISHHKPYHISVIAETKSLPPPFTAFDLAQTLYPPWRPPGVFRSTARCPRRTAHGDSVGPPEARP